METPTVVTAPTPSLVHRVARPVFLFGLSLLGFLFLSEQFALPELLAMRLPGAVLMPSDVLPQRQKLQQQLGELEAYREERIIRRDPLQVFVRDQAGGRASIQRLLDSVLRVTREQAEGSTVVTLQSVDVDASAKTITLEGSLSSATPGTMTLLAAYVDRLTELEQVEGVDATPFTREQVDPTHFRSPFTLTIHGT